MLIRAINYLRNIPEVIIDGSLYVSLGMLTPIMAGISSDDASKYIEAQTLFWIKIITLPAINGFLLSLKMFRSSQYADHKEEKKRINGTGNTQYTKIEDLQK